MFEVVSGRGRRSAKVGLVSLAVAATVLVPSALSSSASAATSQCPPGKSYAKCLGTPGKPSWAGVPKVGAKLQAKPPVVPPGFTIVTVTYTWWVGSKQVGSGTTFTVPGSLSGKSITLHVTYKVKGADDTTATEQTATLLSAVSGSATVAKGTFGTVKGAISGTVKGGKTVKAASVSVSPKPSGTKITYTWYIGSKKVSSAASYKIPTKLAGKSTKNQTLKLVVTVSGTGYVTKTLTKTHKIG